MPIIICVGLIILIISLPIYLFKSSNKIPENWHELKFEIIVISYAIVSQFNDILMRKRNKVDLIKQPSRVAVVTGGNRGIGLQVVKKLLECDMTVVLGVRNCEAARKAVEGLNLDDMPSKLAKVFYEKCDTGDMEMVRIFAKNVQSKFTAIHLLINNAATMAVPYQKTKDGFETQMAVNYIGHFLLTHLLMPQLIEGSNNDCKNSRIINVSSCANEGGRIDYDDFHCEKYYHPGMCYSNSKLAQLMFTKNLERICNENKWKIQSHAPHPGIVDTDIFQNSIIGSLTWLRKVLFKSTEQGARTIVYAAISSRLEGHGGSFLDNCKETSCNKLANDEHECKKLFDLTCNLLNIESFGKIDD